MKIQLTDSRGNKFATVKDWATANEAAKAIFKRQYWSDLYYHIFFDDNTEASGSIDLEPASFHRPHQSKIITTHLKTWWGNIASLPEPKYWLTEEDINRCKTLLTKLPNE